MLRRLPRPAAATFALLLVAGACGAPGAHVLTISGSAVGREADVLRTQLARFEAAHPGVSVQLRATPDAADQRHQLYVQWLNARAGDPDVLQLDVISTPEFAAAGWILPLDRFHPDAGRFFPAAIAADRWNGRLYALPWFVDVGMLYWRTDLVATAPRTFEELDRDARQARSRAVPYGFVWQGARYEGLVTVFLEFLGGFGGQMFDGQGRVTVDSAAAVAALTAMRDEVGPDGIAPEAVLTWQEEQTRFAFQNGQAVFMRNWPYADALLRDAKGSHVAGRFAVAPMPAGPGGHPTGALGGSELAINAYSDQPDEAYALVKYLLQPAQMLERARGVGQYPPDAALYDTPELARALGADPAAIRRIIDGARPRPVTPVYSELSEILQIALHRVLTHQVEPAAALQAAAQQMQAVLDDAGLGGGRR
jgi:ABC-type glycerol-3-phosphate transport system substrate-binding protein